jgi:hypothetical protein
VRSARWGCVEGFGGIDLGMGFGDVVVFLLSACYVFVAIVVDGTLLFLVLARVSMLTKVY